MSSSQDPLLLVIIFDCNKYLALFKQLLRATRVAVLISVCCRIRGPTKRMICNFAFVGRASHWSGGPPAAAMSSKEISPVSFHGKWN